MSVIYCSHSVYIRHSRIRSSLLATIQQNTFVIKRSMYMAHPSTAPKLPRAANRQPKLISTIIQFRGERGVIS